MMSLYSTFYSAALLAPTVSVFPIQGISIEPGGQDIVTCTAQFDEDLAERPTLVWEFPGSDTATTIGDQLGIHGTTTRTLTFNSIHTSQAGVYTCRATIDIQGIDSLSRSASLTVRVQGKLTVPAECPLQYNVYPTTTQPTEGARAASSSSDNTVAIIGGVVAVVIVLIIAATTAIIVAVVLRYRRAEFSPNQK